MKKVKAGKEGADTRIFGVFRAYRSAHKQPRGRYMDLCVGILSYCIHMYPGGHLDTLVSRMYRACIVQDVSTYVLLMYPCM